MKKLLNKKGFTLIELIVVIAILAILAMILIPSLTGYIKKATDAKDNANARAVYSAAMLIGATWNPATSPTGDGVFNAANVATKVKTENPSFTEDLIVYLNSAGTAVVAVKYKLILYPTNFTVVAVVSAGYRWALSQILGDLIVCQRIVKGILRNESSFFIVERGECVF